MTGRPRQTFSRARKLSRATDFARVRSDGRVWRGELVNLAVLIAPDEPGWRAGFIASRRVGGAVVRNRVRRRLREIARLHQHEFRDGVWIVTIVRAAAARANYSALRNEWLRLADRAGLFTSSERS